MYCDNIYYYKNDTNYSNFRWTLDTDEDYALISAIYDRLYKKYGSSFGFNEVLELMESKPDLCKINANVEQTKLDIK